MRRQPKLFRTFMESDSWKLNEHLTGFVNAVFERGLRPSRELYDAIVTAEESGYTHDEMRLAFWVARCVTESWLKEALQGDIAPSIVLRHKGQVNPKTGEPAKRWLDEMISRADETNPVLVGAVLASLPGGLKEGERELLKRMQVKFEEKK